MRGGVDPAGRLVEDEHVRVGDEHGGERQALTLAARQVARVPVLQAREIDCGERSPRAGQVAADGERHFLVCALPDQVAAWILGEVRDAAEPLDPARGRLEQPRDELGKRRLADPVRAGERDDLTTPQLQRGAVEDGSLAVGEGDVMNAAEAFAADRVAAGLRRLPRQVRGAVLEEPLERLRLWGVQQEAPLLDEEDALAALEGQATAAARR